MRWVAVLLVCVWCLAVLSAAENPGLQTRITAKGFNYANSIAIDQLAAKLKSLKIKDIHGSSGKLSYDLTNLHATSFHKPTSGIDLEQNGLKWHIAGAGMAMHGDFHYKLKKIIHISGHGSFDVGVSGLSFSLSMKIGKDAKGQPSVAASGCSASVGSVSVKFHGGQAWIYNMFRGKVEKMIKGQIPNMICKEATNAVNNDAEKALLKLPMTVEIDHRFTLDYRLLNAPIFSPGTYMQTEHKGEVRWKNDASKFPFSTPALAGNLTSGKMMYLWISDYVFDSASYAANQHGFLKYNLTAKDLPAKDRGMLNTTCSGMCIGKLIPEIGKKYPNSVVSVAMHSTNEPKANVNNGKILLSFAGVVDFYATKGSQQFFLVGFGMTLSADATISLKSEKIYGKLGSLSPKVGKVNSTVGEVSAGALQFMIDMVDNMVVVPKINDFGSKGMPLPVTGQIQFKNTELQLAKDTVVIGTDLLYKSKTAEEKTDYKLYFKPMVHNIP